MWKSTMILVPTFHLTISGHRLSLCLSRLGCAAFVWSPQRICRCSKQKDCSEPGKHLQKGLSVADATTDLMKITYWWRKWPKANIGIATGHVSDLVVININAPNRGDKSGKARRALATLPFTPKTITGGGGRHLLFEYLNTAGAKKIAANLKKTGCDVLADGDYFVAPGSAHKSGDRYCWVKGKSIRDLKPAPLAVTAFD